MTYGMLLLQHVWWSKSGRVNICSCSFLSLSGMRWVHHIHHQVFEFSFGMPGLSQKVIGQTLFVSHL